MPVPRKITPLVILQEKLASAVKRERGACLLREEVLALVELLKELGYEENVNAENQPKNP